MEGNIQPTLSFYNITGYVNLDEHGRLREAPPSSATSTATNSASEQKNVIRSRYIAASLYNRLLPRWHFLLKAQQKQMLQHDQQQIQHGHVNTDTQANPKYIIPPSKNSKMGDSASRLPPLHLLAGASDDVFCRQMGLSLTDYLAFKEEAMPRLKFNSQFDRWLKTGRPIDAIVGKE